MCLEGLETRAESVVRMEGIALFLMLTFDNI